MLSLCFTIPEDKHANINPEHVLHDIGLVVLGIFIVEVSTKEAERKSISVFCQTAITPETLQLFRILLLSLSVFSLSFKADASAFLVLISHFNIFMLSGFSQVCGFGQGVLQEQARGAS